MPRSRASRDHTYALRVRDTPRHDGNGSADGARGRTRGIVRDRLRGGAPLGARRRDHPHVRGDAGSPRGQLREPRRPRDDDRPRELHDADAERVQLSTARSVHALGVRDDPEPRSERDGGHRNGRGAGCRGRAGVAPRMQRQPLDHRLDTAARRRVRTAARRERRLRLRAAVGPATPGAADERARARHPARWHRGHAYRRDLRRDGRGPLRALLRRRGAGARVPRRDRSGDGSRPADAVWLHDRCWLGARRGERAVDAGHRRGERAARVHRRPLLRRDR
jgi:hypothetical protein